MKIFSDDWLRKRSSVKSKLSTSITESIMSSASVIYLGVLTKQKQTELTDLWKIIFTEKASDYLSLPTDFSLVDILSSDEEQHDWIKSSLLKDQFAIDNALRMRTISVLGQKCWPLLIDPHDVGEKWVRLMEDKIRSSAGIIFIWYFSLVVTSQYVVW